MATTTFVDNVTQTAADWFNDVDRLQYDILNDPADLAALVATLGATNWTITGNLSVQGNTTIGNASGDSLTFHPNAWTLSNAVTVTGTWANLGTVTTADINGGTIDGAVIGGSSAAAGSFTTLASTGLSVVNSAASLLRATINASNASAQQVDIAFTNSGGSTYIGQDAAGYSFIDARGALNAITLGYSGAVVTTIDSTGLTMASGMSIRGSNNLTLNATTGNSVIAQVNNATVGTFSSTGLAVTGQISSTYDAGANLLTIRSSTQPVLRLTDDGVTTLVDLTIAGGEGRLRTATNHPLVLLVNNAEVGRFSSTGLAVTGALSATNNVSATRAGDVEFRATNTSTTGSSVVGTTNNAGTVSQLMNYGSAQPAYGALGAGQSAVYTTATKLVLMADNVSGVVEIAAGGNTTKASFSSTGLAVTGALSCSTNLTVTGGTITTGSTTALSLATSGGTVLQLVNAGGGVFTGYIEGAEQTAPAAPAANGYRIYAEDNGAGKTRLMVKFATGAAQQIAIEP